VKPGSFAGGRHEGGANGSAIFAHGSARAARQSVRNRGPERPVGHALVAHPVRDDFPEHNRFVQTVVPFLRGIVSDARRVCAPA